MCPFEIPAGLQATVGTGFLVAPDLCLTNYHVVSPLINHTQSRGRPAALRLPSSGRRDGRRRGDMLLTGR